MPEFAWPWVALLLPLPWLLRRWLRPLPPGQALHLPHPGVALAAIERQPGRGRANWWLALAWLCLVVAAARPQWVGPPQAQQRSGRAMLLAIDLSGSMRTEDMQLAGQDVSRFEAVEAIAGDFITRRAGDELGLVLFGSRAFLVTAVTIVGAILLNIASGALARVIAENYMGGTMGVAAAYRAIRPRIPALIGVMLIIMLSAVLAFIPPLFLWIYISLSFVSQVIVLENRGVGDALQRSWELVRGSWWRVFGAYLLLLLVGMIVNLSTTVISLAVGLTGASWAVQNIAVQFVTLLLTVVYRPISLAGMTLLYFDLRIRKEGYDLQVALDARARETGLAPAGAGAAWPYRESAPAAPAAPPAGWPYGEATQA